MLEPYLTGKQIGKCAKILIGTVLVDLHDIGDDGYAQDGGEVITLVKSLLVIKLKLCRF